jgi:hypothetical protein
MIIGARIRKIIEIIMMISILPEKWKRVFAFRKA